MMMIRTIIKTLLILFILFPTLSVASNFGRYIGNDLYFVYEIGLPINVLAPIQFRNWQDLRVPQATKPEAAFSYDFLAISNSFKILSHRYSVSFDIINNYHINFSDLATGRLLIPDNLANFGRFECRGNNSGIRTRVFVPNRYSIRRLGFIPELGLGTTYYFRGTGHSAAIYVSGFIPTGNIGYNPTVDARQEGYSFSNCTNPIGNRFSIRGVPVFFGMEYKYYWQATNRLGLFMGTGFKATADLDVLYNNRKVASYNPSQLYVTFGIRL